MPRKKMEISQEIANQMYHFYDQEKWSCNEISNWLRNTYQIEYSSVSIHRYLTAMASAQIVDSSDLQLDTDDTDSIALLKQFQKYSYKRSVLGDQQKNDKKWRESAQLFLQATSLLLRQGNGGGPSKEEPLLDDTSLPTFVVAPPLPS